MENKKKTSPNVLYLDTSSRIVLLLLVHFVFIFILPLNRARRHLTKRVQSLLLILLIVNGNVEALSD